MPLVLSSRGSMTAISSRKDTAGDSSTVDFCHLQLEELHVANYKHLHELSQPAMQESGCKAMRQPLKALQPRNAWINPAIVFLTL